MERKGNHTGETEGTKEKKGMKYKKLPVPKVEHLPGICLDIFNLPLFGNLIFKWFLYFNRGSVKIRGNEGSYESDTDDSPKRQKS